MSAKDSSRLRYERRTNDFSERKNHCYLFPKKKARNSVLWYGITELTVIPTPVQSATDYSYEAILSNHLFVGDL
jgi:hypothetical protein